MGRPNSKRRIPQGKEGWTPAEGSWYPLFKIMRCSACGDGFKRNKFYDKHRWAEPCGKPPPTTAAPVAAGGDGAPAVAAAPYVRHASAPSGPGQTETRGEPGASIPSPSPSPPLPSPPLSSPRNETAGPAPSGGEGRSVSSDGGLAARMAAQEMNAELHVGAVITKTFGTRGSFLGQVPPQTLCPP